MPRKYTSPQGRIDCTCLYCGKSFSVAACYVRQGAAKHCSVTCSALTRRGGAIERFWTKVQKSPDPDGCWLWTGAMTRQGYGLARGTDRRQTTAHRVAWGLTNGEIPDGLDLCHNCPTGDTKLCVRPDHMFLGTHQDNMADAAEKGATALGERNGQVKLDATAVLAIRQRYAAGSVTNAILGSEYGVTPSLISMIVTRKIWKHI